jgi:hypothetical protein
VRTRWIALLAVSAAAALLAGCTGDRKTSSARAGSSSGGSASAAASAGSSSGAGSGGSAGDLSGLTAAQLLAKAQAALAAAPALHIGGAVTSQGTSTTLDFDFTDHGSKGFITVQGSRVELVAVNKIVYFRAPDDFWKKFAAAQASAVLPVVHGRWVKVAQGDKNFASFAAVADRQGFTADFLTPSGAPKLGTAKAVNGIECLALVDGDSTLYVSKSDARPIEIAGGGSTGGKLDLRYGGITEPTAPPASEVVDSSKFGG